jgi:hypothetical protein
MVLNGTFDFESRDSDLRKVFQEYNPGVKRELLVLGFLQSESFHQNSTCIFKSSTYYPRNIIAATDNL